MGARDPRAGGGRPQRDRNRSARLGRGSDAARGGDARRLRDARDRGARGRRRAGGARRPQHGRRRDHARGRDGARPHPQARLRVRVPAARRQGPARHDAAPRRRRRPDPGEPHHRAAGRQADRGGDPQGGLQQHPRGRDPRRDPPPPAAAARADGDAGVARSGLRRDPARLRRLHTRPIDPPAAPAPDDRRRRPRLRGLRARYRPRADAVGDRRVGGDLGSRATSASA